MKPIFVPLLHNGNGSVMANFMMCHGEAFAGRTIDMRAIGDSHAGRGMNRTACDFLESNCDTWLNIDADILFTSKDVAKILAPGISLLYGLYPKKQDDTPPCIGTFAQVDESRPDGLVEVRRAGRGFMRVDRSLLEAMKEENGGHARKFFNHGREEWEFFESGVVTGEMSAMDGGRAEWISEDWYFCERARQVGVPTLVDPTIALGHEGSKVFRFNMNQVERIDTGGSWEQIPGWFTREDAEAYRAIVTAIPDGGKFLEVGCWLGRSLSAFCEFAQAAGKKVEVHAVDTFEGTPGEGGYSGPLAVNDGNVRAAFEANIQAGGFRDSVTVHEGESREFAKAFGFNTLDAVFLDGDHSFRGVASDIAAFLPSVRSGGIFAGHDADYPDVMRAVREFFPADQIKTIGRCWLVKIP